MKNLLLAIVCCTFFGLTSCGDSASSGDAGAASVAGIAIPSFGDKALTEYAQKYAKYIGKYEEAMKSGDASAISKLGTEGQDLSTAAAKISSGMSQADALKFSTFMQEVSKRMQNAAK